MLYEIKGDCIEVKLNCELYAKETILQVAYHFIDEYYVYLDYEYEEKKRYIRIVLEPKKKTNINLRQAAGEFVNELLNQNLRACITGRTEGVRKLVLARALFTSYLDESEEIEEEQETEYNIESIAKDWFDGKYR